MADTDQQQIGQHRNVEGFLDGIINLIVHEDVRLHPIA
jgi:hypothetical protein